MEYVSKEDQILDEAWHTQAPDPLQQLLSVVHNPEVLAAGIPLPENIKRAEDLRPLISPNKDIAPPTFLVEGVACEAIADIKLSMDALCEWEPTLDYTQTQSAQGTCRVAAYNTSLLISLCGKHKLEDSRHSYFLRITKALQKLLLKQEPCAPDVGYDDPRLLESIAAIISWMEHGDTILNTKSTSKDRKAAAKAFNEAVRG